MSSFVPRDQGLVRNVADPPVGPNDAAHAVVAVDALASVDGLPGPTIKEVMLRHQVDVVGVQIREQGARKVKLLRGDEVVGEADTAALLKGLVEKEGIKAEILPIPGVEYCKRCNEPLFPRLNKTGVCRECLHTPTYPRSKCRICGKPVRQVAAYWKKAERPPPDTSIHRTCVPKTCTIPGCNKPHDANGFCQYHNYQRDGAARTCSVDGCDKPHVAKGFCKKHYYHSSYQPHPKATTQVCTIDGCMRPHCSRGLCEMHYRRKLRASKRSYREEAAQVDSPPVDTSA